MQLRSLCVQVRGGFHVASNLFRTHQNASITATCGLKNEKFPVSRLYSSVQNSTVAQSKSLDGGGSGNAYSMCRRDFFGYFMVCLGENRELFTPRALACSTVPGKFTVFVDRINLFSLCYPMECEILNKAGAKLFLRDSADNNSQVGVTVNPVKISTLSEFGSVHDVGERLVAAEATKESTLPGGVTLIREGSRQGPRSGSTFYDYEYQLTTTRGKKLVFNTVAVDNNLLYILNIQVKERIFSGQENDKSMIDDVVAGFRTLIQTFDVGQSTIDVSSQVE